MLTSKPLYYFFGVHYKNQILDTLQVCNFAMSRTILAYFVLKRHTHVNELFDPLFHGFAQNKIPSVLYVY
jgi:hypothetical protein